MKKEKTKKTKTHTIIISDLHLGSKVSQPEKTLAMLENYSFQKLILLGDVFDNMDFRNLSKECWNLLTYIGKISKNKKVRWVIGNHDEGLVNIFKSLMDAKIYETYVWHYKQKKYLAIHGHQFDRFLVNNAMISYLANKIYNFIQRIDSNEKKFSHYLKKKSKGWLRLSEKVARSAIIYGKENGADFVFCGHTHKSIQRKNHKIKYFNSGCWDDTPCSYITINDGGIKIQEYI
ncbi:MAG TPA: UDP-2,3-diacylglucosamine diphosphatase [Candidatus Moranbacteria bacterium]|nr:UDP-2,3-diacylglucosamine diphosphatase [Candidatus Moranbacteria bacterium]HRZ33455.1 UDP-2,3-diacylglucosamine diphosphatase [Candidatus Moranbacteria bacterium]